MSFKQRVADTGRIGEATVFQYLLRQEEYSDWTIVWLNKNVESGDPYDIFMT